MGVKFGKSAARRYWRIFNFMPNCQVEKVAKVSSYMRLKLIILQVNRTNYAVYHSVHDNFYWMSHFCDPSFNYHLTISLIWMKLALILSTDPVLPFDPRDYAIALDEIYQNLSKERSDILYGQGISLGKCVTLLPTPLCTCISSHNYLNVFVRRMLHNFVCLVCAML